VIASHGDTHQIEKLAYKRAFNFGGSGLFVQFVEHFLLFFRDFAFRKRFYRGVNVNIVLAGLIVRLRFGCL
jgi:hypothetical protein